MKYKVQWEVEVEASSEKDAVDVALFSIKNSNTPDGKFYVRKNSLAAMTHGFYISDKINMIYKKAALYNRYAQ